MSAQIVRAILFAIATTATFFGRRFTNSVNHSGGDLLCVSTARAPWISSVRRYLSPRLLMPDIALDPGSALRHHLAVLREQSPQTVDLRGAKLHQLLSHPVQRQYRLLFLALDRYDLDLRLLHRRPDRACIRGIVLVAHHKRLDH